MPTEPAPVDEVHHLCDVVLFEGIWGAAPLRWLSGSDRSANMSHHVVCKLNVVIALTAHISRAPKPALTLQDVMYQTVGIHVRSTSQ